MAGIVDVVVTLVVVGSVDVVRHSEQPAHSSFWHFSDQSSPMNVPSQNCEHDFVEVDVDVLVDVGTVGVGHALHITGHHSDRLLTTAHASGFRGATPQSGKSALPPWSQELGAYLAVEVEVEVVVGVAVDVVRMHVRHIAGQYRRAKTAAPPPTHCEA